MISPGDVEVSGFQHDMEDIFRNDCDPPCSRSRHNY